jgi:hypothetical protein
MKRLAAVAALLVVAACQARDDNAATDTGRDTAAAPALAPAPADTALRDTAGRDTLRDTLGRKGDTARKTPPQKTP